MQGEQIYNQAPRNGGKRIKGKKGKQDDEIDEDDSEFIDMKKQKKAARNPNNNLPIADADRKPKKVITKNPN